MDEVVGLLYEISKNAPALLGLITLVALIFSAVVFGSKSARFSSIRASIKRLKDSLDRTKELLGEIGESSDRLEAGVDDIETTTRAIRDRAIEADQGITDALDLLRRIQGGDGHEDSPSNGD
jgi:septal ring factor EnvC (AmiA/AmiB activator)